MNNTFGQALTLTLFGESHGKEIGAILDGLAPGMPVDEDFIRHQLALRRPQGRISTARCEADAFSIVSGVYRGVTTGAPLCLTIPNADTHSSDYDPAIPRPAHADLSAHFKYHGFADPRGGGHFSGRLTAPLVAVSAILLDALKKKGIRIGTHLSSVGSICDRPFDDLAADIDLLSSLSFPVLSGKAGEQMRAAIEEAREASDSLGGVLETAVTGLPSGLGEPWFDSFESLLSHAIFSIPAVKGLEFGDGFALSRMRGSEANDGICITQDGSIGTLSNHGGGIGGGITNGMPVLFRTAIKPTPSIARAQASVNLETREDVTLSIKGRHDPCIAHRAAVVVSSMTAFVVCDLLTRRYGTDFLATP